MRKNRSTSYDLQKHLVTGKRGPQSGSGIVRDIDNPDMDRDDPQEFTAGDGIEKPATMGDMLAATMRGTGINTGVGDLGQPMNIAKFSESDVMVGVSKSSRVPGNR